MITVTHPFPEELLKKVTNKFPNLEITKDYDWQVLIVDREELHSLCEFLKSDSELDFDFLTDLSGVDYIDYMLVVYHLYSYKKGHKLVVKTKITRDDPVVDSVTSLWSTANWHEREAYDLYGIIFKGHPNLKRIFCTDDFPGHAFRKDFPLENDEEYLLRDVKEPEEYGIPRELPS